MPTLTVNGLAMFVVDVLLGFVSYTSLACSVGIGLTNIACPPAGARGAVCLVV